MLLKAGSLSETMVARYFIAFLEEEKIEAGGGGNRVKGTVLGHLQVCICKYNDLT